MSRGDFLVPTGLAVLIAADLLRVMLFMLNGNQSVSVSSLTAEAEFIAASSMVQPEEAIYARRLLERLV